MAEEKKQDNTATGDLKVKWDAENMTTSYANVVNANSTREEFSVFFGTNQSWTSPENGEFTVSLDNRIVLNPYAAKRLSIILNRSVAEYEKQFGEMKLGNS